MALHIITQMSECVERLSLKNTQGGLFFRETVLILSAVAATRRRPSTINNLSYLLDAPTF
jgi:hypothetical protein